MDERSVLLLQLRPGQDQWLHIAKPTEREPYACKMRDLRRLDPLALFGGGGTARFLQDGTLLGVDLVSIQAQRELVGIGAYPHLDGLLDALGARR